MLKTALLHPEILNALARGGHHSKILIADGNYPAATKKGPNATVVHLNLAPGLVTVAQVLRVLLTAIPVDEINTMGVPPDDPYAAQGDPPVWHEYREIIRSSGSSLSLKPVLKWDFYRHVESADHLLTVQTADQALWGNLLLTMGCVTP